MPKLKKCQGRCGKYYPISDKKSENYISQNTPLGQGFVRRIADPSIKGRLEQLWLCDNCYWRLYNEI